MPLHQDERYPHQFTFTVRLNANLHGETIKALQEAIAQAKGEIQGNEDPCKRVLIQLVELLVKGRRPVQFGSSMEMLLYNIEQHFGNLQDLITEGFTETIGKLNAGVMVAGGQALPAAPVDSGDYEPMPDTMLDSLIDDMFG